MGKGKKSSKCGTKGKVSRKNLALKNAPVKGGLTRSKQSEIMKGTGPGQSGKNDRLRPEKAQKDSEDAWKGEEHEYKMALKILAEQKDLVLKAKAAEAWDEPEEWKEGDKKEKWLTPKQKKRKEVTSLYAELINPGLEKKNGEGAALVADILTLLDSRPAPLYQYCSSEIGSRVVQAVLKWGTAEHRRKVLLELKDRLARMAVDRYGHVVVMKMLRYGSRTSTGRKPDAKEKKQQTQNLRDFMEAFHGKGLRHAFFHKHGCKVMNQIYFSEEVTTKEKRMLLHEIAVPASVTLTRAEAPTAKTLRQLLASEEMKEHMPAILQHMEDVCEKAIDKELLGVDVVHLIFQAFCELATEKQLRELAERSMAGAPHLLSSKPGAEALLYIFGVSVAKERKAFMKELKGKFLALATNAVDYLVIMRLYSTLDDTVLLQKTMLAEWTSDPEGIATMCFDKYGHKVLAWIFRPEDPHFFSPYEMKCLMLPAPGSVKAPDLRRQEVLRALRPAVREVLKASPLKMAADVNAKNLLLAYLRSDWDAEIVAALIDAAEAESKSDDFGLLNEGTVTTTLLALLKMEIATGDSDTAFALPLWKRCFAPRLASAISSRSVFAVLALLKHDATADLVRNALQKSRKDIDAAVKAAEAAGSPVNGAQKLLAAMDEAPAAKEAPEKKGGKVLKKRKIA